MEATIPSPRSQKPTNGSCSEPDQSTHRPVIQFYLHDGYCVRNETSFLVTAICILF
jgi:hypothetical protein